MHALWHGERRRGNTRADVHLQQNTLRPCRITPHMGPVHAQLSSRRQLQRPLLQETGLACEEAGCSFRLALSCVSQLSQSSRQRSLGGVCQWRCPGFDTARLHLLCACPIQGRPDSWSDTVAGRAVMPGVMTVLMMPALGIDSVAGSLHCVVIAQDGTVPSHRSRTFDDVTNCRTQYLKTHTGVQDPVTMPHQRHITAEG